ncbi:MAG: hypothetical protein ACXAC7_09735, partial [Candidatus Hodarchaeales archaeon]
MIKSDITQRMILLTLLICVLLCTPSFERNKQTDITTARFSIHPDTMKIATSSDVQTMSSLTSSYFYEQELTALQVEDLVYLLENQSHDIKIKEMVHDGNFLYLLANYRSFNLNLFSGEIQNYPISFDNGTPSLQAGFVIILSDNEVSKVVNLDLDDDFDYSFVSFEKNENGIYFLAERTYIGSGQVDNQTDIALFRYDHEFQLQNQTILGGMGDDLLGMENVPFTDLLEIDSDGNVIIAGKSTNDVISPGSIIQAIPSNFVAYSKSMDFEDIYPIHKILVLYGEDNITVRDQVLSHLSGYNLEISTLDLISNLPTLEELLEYQLIIPVISYFDNGSSYNNYVGHPVSIGNVLADYADAGGKIVAPAYSIIGDGEGTWRISGRLSSEGYIPFTAGYTNNYVRTYTTNRTQPSFHPIFYDVTNITTQRSISSNINPQSGSMVIRYDSDHVFLAKKNNVMSINLIFDSATGNVSQFLFNCIQNMAEPLVLPSVSNVLILHDNQTAADDVVSMLSDQTTLFTQDTSSYIPTLSDLMQYSAVMVMTNNSYLDRSATGDILADFVDVGGKLILAGYTLSSGQGITGRLRSDNYLPFTISNTDSYSSYSDSFNENMHPVFNGTSFTATSNMVETVLGKLMGKSSPNSPMKIDAVMPGYIFHADHTFQVENNSQARIIGAYNYQNVHTEPIISLLDNVMAWNFYPGLSEF